MLEHAEISIQEAETLATSTALAKEDRATATVKQGIALVKSQWNGDELPQDVRRLASNITDLIRELHLEVGRLEEILNQGKAARAGLHPSNLSPYSTVVQYLLDAERDKMISLLQSDQSSRRVLIPGEIEFPAEVDRSLLKNALFVTAA
jgi:hypothetical protein